MKLFITDSDSIYDALSQHLNKEQAQVIRIPETGYRLTLGGVGDTLYELAIERKRFVVTCELTGPRLDKALASVNPADIINACRSTPEGQLNFDLTVGRGVKGAMRLWLSTLSDITDADLNRLAYNTAYEGLARPVLAERLIDLYIMRRGPEVMGTRIPVNMKGLFALALLKKRMEEIETYKLTNYFKLSVTYGGHTGLWSDMKGEGKLPSSEAAHEIIQQLTGQRVMVATIKQDITMEKHPLLYNTADLLKDALEAKVPTTEAKWALEQLFKKGHISNPVTNSRHIPTTMATELMPILKALKESGRHRLHLEYMKQKVGATKLGERVLNNAFIDEQHAIVPTAKPPIGALPSAEEEALYTLITRRFLGIFLGDRYYDKAVVRGYVNSEHRIDSEMEKTIFHGFRIMDEENDYIGALLQDPKREQPRLDLGMRGGDLIPITGLEPRVRSAKEPTVYKERALLKLLDTAGERQIGEKKKNLNRNNGIGSLETRSDGIRSLKDNGLIEITDNGLVVLTEQGREAAKGLPKLIADPAFIKYMNQRLLSLKEGEESVSKVVQECCERFTSATIQSAKIEEANQTVDYASVIKVHKCPICHSQLAYDDQHIRCTSRNLCSLRLAKVMSGHVLTAEELGQLLMSGRTNLIETFRFKSTDKGTAYLVLNRAKGRAEFEFPPRGSAHTI